MSTKVELKLKPTSIIKADLGIEPNGPVHAFFTETCYRYMDKYVPRRPGSIGGALREEVDLTTNSITYNQPYASYQYFGIRADGTRVVMNYSTPGTGPYWDERMWSAESSDVVSEVQKHFDTHGGK